ncbi:hypothetical protein ACVPPR_01230 [Dellaglioa sp. L3N]
MAIFIQLKQVMRNKRFLFFTIVIPSLWYLFMINLAKDNSTIMPEAEKQGFFLIACLFGIMGNSIVTFSKKINGSKRYYLLKSKTSHYSIWNFMFDQLLIQLIINVIISLIISIIGSILGAIIINITLFELIGLLSILGIYFSAIGFALGLTMDSVALDAGGFPLMAIVALLIVPFYTFSSGWFVHLITNVQSAFPGYYLYQINSKLIKHTVIDIDLMKFLISFFVTLMPFMGVIWVKLIKKAQ